MQNIYSGKTGKEDTFMGMMTLEEVVKKLEDTKRKDLKIISDETGLNLNFLVSLKYGTRTNPTYHNIKKLSDFFDGN